MNFSDAFFRAVQYSSYRAKAVNEHSIHSPFVFDLYTNVIKSQASYYAYDRVEALRSKMLLSKKKINVEDFGTGGEKVKTKNLSLAYIASHYVKPPKYGQLFFRLVNYFKPRTILEIGTSLGITTLYLTLPEETAQVITLEGSEETAAQARNNFQTLNVSGIEIVTGEFSDTIPRIVNTVNRLNFVYFDGNHKKAPTLEYFNHCLKRHDENSVFVFDDIYWSREMASAWEQIKNNVAVTLSIDLYSLGIIFFRPGVPKQHFILRY